VDIVFRIQGAKKASPLNGGKAPGYSNDLDCCVPPPLLTSLGYLLKGRSLKFFSSYHFGGEESREIFGWVSAWRIAPGFSTGRENREVSHLPHLPRILIAEIKVIAQPLPVFDVTCRGDIPGSEVGYILGKDGVRNS